MNSQNVCDEKRFFVQPRGTPPTNSLKAKSISDNLQNVFKEFIRTGLITFQESIRIDPIYKKWVAQNFPKFSGQHLKTHTCVLMEESDFT